jgi:hypothetical protein
MHIDAKVLNQLLAKHIHQHSKIIHHEQLRFILGMQGLLNISRKKPQCNTSYL